MNRLNCHNKNIYQKSLHLFLHEIIETKMNIPVTFYLNRLSCTVLSIGKLRAVGWKTGQIRAERRLLPTVFSYIDFWMLSASATTTWSVFIISYLTLEFIPKITPCLTFVCFTVHTALPVTNVYNFDNPSSSQECYFIAIISKKIDLFLVFSYENILLKILKC